MKRLFVVAAIATLATAAQAQNQNATQTQTNAAASTTATPATTNVAAAGQTTATVTDPEATATAGKSWSVSVVNQTSVDANQLNYSNNKSKSYGSVNYVGAAFKLDPKNRVGLRQYFGIKHDGVKNENKTTVMDPVVTYTRSGMDGVLKSDPLSATFWYYIPTSDTAREANSNGTLRMDMEIAWTLNPKWSVSYYLNPRQNFIPEGEMVVDGKLVPVFSKTTLIHYGYLYYSFNDSAQAYTYGGLMHRWKTSTQTLSDQETLAGLGISFSFLGGKLSLNPEVSLASTTVEGFAQKKSEDLFQEKNISYVMTSAFVF